MHIVDKKEFRNAVKRFSKMEDTRDEIWYRAELLLKKGYDLDAYLLILTTWNFARFRYALIDFDLGGFEKLLKHLNPVFRKLRKQRFETADLDSLSKDIAQIYDSLANVGGVEYTGATKIMALKNSGLFVMWDVAIRKMYNKELVRGEKIPQQPTGQDYVRFLKYSRSKFQNIKTGGKFRCLAKVIDEYNYVKAKKYR